MTGDDIVFDVINAIAESDGIEPSEVDFNLSDHINPEALEKLGEVQGGVWELAFRVSDHHVRLNHDGTIFIDGRRYEADSVVQE
ncbi:HalOD1 output domain-containing protein [Haloarculaceae archaeon H-GB2-1]|nr:hypothetical protein [Haloarculaceae archaeon H-GB1-1]MEA5406779.1 HalOD1 output domain-containing protein [Haloarculaceae archaeon H-GB2-1]